MAQLMQRTTSTVNSMSHSLMNSLKILVSEDNGKRYMVLCSYRVSFGKQIFTDQN